MELTLTAAAQATGKGKSTLLRAVKSGKLSSRRTEDGAFMVDASELARVFPVKHLERVSGAPMTSHGEPWSASELHDAERVSAVQARLIELEKLTAVREARLEARDALLERERETVQDLRKRLDRAEERILTLTHQVSQAHETTRPRKLIERLLGRFKAAV